MTMILNDILTKIIYQYISILTFLLFIDIIIVVVVSLTRF